jgi:SAM-dependent methyltransferase
LGQPDAATVPDPSGYGYFDEAYFERGHLRGTAYCNYRRSARASATYREVAERIAYVFGPTRALEIGCATGMVVKHLNDLGCEAHGIDVSEWAIENREHSHVQRAGAEALPYEDEAFDLVYSIHALEHVPRHLATVALEELTRVARPDAAQFHLLPIVGRGPYGDPASVEGLKKDPTHNLVWTLEEWLAAWARTGWQDSGAVVLIRNDTDSFELSSCQYVLSREGIPRRVLERVRESNIDVARTLFLDSRRRQTTYSEIPLDALSTKIPLEEPSILEFTHETWRDLTSELTPPLSLERAKFHVITTLFGHGPRRFRLAVVNSEREAITGDYRNVSEKWIDVPEGIAQVQTNMSELDSLRGSVDPSAVSAVLFGGSAEGCIVHVRVDVDLDGVRTRLL